jgi:hypothetical protein
VLYCPFSSLSIWGLCFLLYLQISITMLPTPAYSLTILFCTWFFTYSQQLTCGISSALPLIYNCSYYPESTFQNKKARQILFLFCETSNSISFNIFLSKFLLNEPFILFSNSIFP